MKHNKKLARDITSCHNYIAWQSYADIKTSQCKNSRKSSKPKPSRIPSRKMQRLRLKASTTTAPQTSAESSDTPSASSTCPPPFINLSSSTNLSTGYFGIFEKGPKFVPTPLKQISQNFKRI